MASGRLLVDEEGDALVVRIDNAGRANALDEAILESLASLLEGPRPASSAAVLLAGAGERHFSAGLDLADRTADELTEYLQDGERRLGRVARAIEGCARPVIGVVNGAVVGGALELAMACDWRIARRGAELRMPAARLGVVYAVEGLRRFVAALGPARTRRLFLTGARIDADEALRIGLVDQVVEPAELWPVAMAAAGQVAEGAPLAIEGTRAIVRVLSDGPLDGALEAEAAGWRERAFRSEDFREGLAAIRERRPPRFRGR